MSNQAKSSSTPLYQVSLYSKALHPELFHLKGRRVHSKNSNFELETWLMNGSHLLRFEHGRLCLCELVTDQDHRELPTAAAVGTFVCASEHDYEHLFAREGVNYMTTVQAETVSEHQYFQAHEEYLALAKERNSLAHQWQDELGACLSLVHVEQSKTDVNIEAYHLQALTRTVLRSQSIFELIH